MSISKRSSFVCDPYARAIGPLCAALLSCVACKSGTDSALALKRVDPKAAHAGNSAPVSMVSGGSGQSGNGGIDNPSDTLIVPVVSSGGNSGGVGCTGLQCQQHTCASGSTTITGKVYDPAGKNPLYNVAVYVPNETPGSLTLGASCAQCDTLYTGKPVVTSLSDAGGNFKIENAPDGDNIPLVVQIGKWRKQTTVPHVAQCTETKVSDKLTLPRNHKEGDIPSIAISTGAADTLECLLRRIGVDASEYTPGATGDGRVHIFQGSKGMGNRGGAGDAPNTSPAAPMSPSGLWPTTAELMKYDIVLLSCEGQETSNMQQAALHDYADKGGRVFASHFHYAWFNSGPYASENLATWTPGSNSMGNIGGTIVTTFPKGMALQQWLTNTNALVNGELPIQEARHNADVASANFVSQPWILADDAAMPPKATQYFSFNTPTTAAQTPDDPGYCGRVVFSDLHVGAASHDDASMPVPTGCSNVDLSPQEKALEFMLFDLSACVIPDNRPPLPPPVLN